MVTQARHEASRADPRLIQGCDFLFRGFARRLHLHERGIHRGTGDDPGEMKSDVDD